VTRQALSKRIRFEVFKRDRFTCQYCGGRPPDVLLQVDHIVAVGQGGSNEPDNLATSCVACNAGKSDKGLGATLPVIDEMARLEAMQEMAERATLLKQEKTVAQVHRQAETEVVEAVQGWWEDIGGSAEMFESSSVRRFIGQLSIEQIREAIDAVERKWARYPNGTQGHMWKYFCGACWQMIRGPR
jgi:hypothetical protein